MTLSDIFSNRVATTRLHHGAVLVNTSGAIFLILESSASLCDAASGSLRPWVCIKLTDSGETNGVAASFSVFSGENQIPRDFRLLGTLRPIAIK